MATVFKAYDTRLERDVAIKIIRKGAFPADHVDHILKRFEREAKALARLSHPNIVKVHDFGEHDGYPYLVMEYLPSGTLKQKMGKPISWQEAVQLLLPIAEALDYAHSQNMIHRDVKPSNILLTDRGQPMLTDFGIAKVLDMEETIDLTGTSAAVGTPEYMAPEQATARTADHRADIYALGVVLYEMVTGRKPFIADTPMAVLIKHATEPLPRPKQFVSSLPEAVEKILLKALSKNPEDRFQSMAELVACFQKLLGSREQTFENPLKEKEVRSKAGKEKTAYPISQWKSIAAKRTPTKPTVFWLVGFVGVIFIIGMLVSDNWYQSTPFVASTSIDTSLTDIVVTETTVAVTATEIPSQVSIATIPPSPVPSAKGSGRILFVSNRDGNEEIYVMNSNGSQQTRLTENVGRDFSPKWSPNGTKIAFLSERLEGNGLYIMNIDGSDQKLLTISSSGNLGDISSFSWAPDGGKIAFISYDGDSDLSVISLDTLGQSKLIDTPNINEFDPAWSPDGSKIAFFREKGLFIIDQDGNNEVEIASNTSWRNSLDWSPDGSKIAFGGSGTSLYDEIFIADVNSDALIQLTENNNEDMYPVWSTDGNQIAFISSRYQGNYEIFTMNSDGTNVNKLSSFFDRQIYLHEPHWSPTTETMVIDYLRWQSQTVTTQKIYQIDVKNGNTRDVSGSSSYGDWSVDVSP